ncbi:DNA primase, partial [Candidatus Peregrinibacteria bacterium]|nr:DNA primase [Candidatus Peregrinibacteria bacterium]
SKLFQKKEKSEKDEYFKANDLACEFFQKQLLSTSEGKKVLEYLHGRGVTDQTIEDFKLGFAPDKYDALYPELLKKGIRKEVLIKSGFVSAKNVAADQIFDKYRGRLMFPIFDYLGRICGFGGRALSEGQMPKYLNSADNIVYNKSDVLYGFSHAKQAIKEKNQIILVEGYFDVL